ncbi:MAG TPA: hypothetical protein DGB72_14700 [Gemmatimonadetes bacterium]|jgi:hypothetical protein|nr:hypothetical protein [Gemmatimonadota bacterium]
MSSTSRPPELQAIIDEIGRAGPFASVEEVNRLFALRVREYNATPQAVLIPRYRNPPYSIRRSRFGIKVNALARRLESVFGDLAEKHRMRQSLLPVATPWQETGVARTRSRLRTGHVVRIYIVDTYANGGLEP